jgi:DNA-binding response OmpR family regulator
MRVLVIDDEPDAATFLRALLEDEGYGVVTASDAETGRLLLERQPFDLVLLDVQMPGESGVHLYADLARRNPRERLPVIIVTGVGSFTLFDETCHPLPLPAAVVEKPVERAALLAAVRNAIAGQYGV